MKRLFQISLCILTAATVMSSCGKKTSSAPKKEKQETTSMSKAPVFQADSAFHFAGAQCDFGPRVPNTQAHQDCGEYIAAQFEAYGAQITNQFTDLKAYDGTILKARNIIASLYPERTYRIMLCAHWDSRPWCDNDPNPDNWKKPVMGANDGASGVAVMMEMARLIQQQPLEKIGIDFICFDAEDWGEPQWEESQEDNSLSWCLGSQYWSTHPHQPNYRPLYGILLDMVGGQGTTFSQEAFSMEYAPHVVAKVWNTAEAIGYGNYFIRRPSGYITDDHVPVNQLANIPCIDIVPYVTSGPSSFGPTWHTVKDDMEHLDKNVLKAVGQTVIQVIYNEDKNENYQ